MFDLRTFKIAGVPERSKGMVSRTIGLVPSEVRILPPAFLSMCEIQVNEIFIN